MSSMSGRLAGGGLLPRLRDWLARGPQPPLRRPCALYAGAPAAYVLDIATAAQGRPLVIGATEADAAAVVDREIDAGCDLILLAAPEAAPTVALAAIAAFTGEEPVRALGFDPLLSDQEWMARVVAVRDALHRVELSVDLPAALAALGDPALACATGALRRALHRRTPVVLDGVAALAAAILLAHYDELDTGRLQLASADAGPAASAARRALGLDPLLDLGATDAGVAGAVVLGLLRAAILVPDQPAGGVTLDQAEPSAER